jgi:hypothetical protein
MFHCSKSHQRGAQLGAEPNLKWSSFLTPLLLLVLLPLLVSSRANSQVLYGSLTGDVTDQKGSVVPGVKVEARNVGTSRVWEATTDANGGYQFSDLAPGVYNVTFGLTSFKTVIKENVKIEPNTIQRVDAQMQVGELKETVVVASDGTPTLQTDRSDLNITQNSRQVNDLPLTGSLGRNYQSLMMLIPGAVGAGEQNSAAGNPQRSISFNVNGVSRLQNNTRIDGAGVVYPWLPTNTVYVPPAEAIQTVNIVTNAFDAEQGLAGGAAVNVTIKQGGNSFHGVGWGYDTNSWFQSRSYFQSPTQVNLPKRILAQYGYAISGPIIKNKLFFFTDLERTTQRQNASPAPFTIAPGSLRPDAAGNVNFTGTGITVYDPTSNANPALRTPFANNTIPANRIDIGSLELLKRLPATNNGNSLSGNYIAGGSALFNRTNIDTKINYNYSSKMTLFGRYSYSPTLIYEPPVFGPADGPALNGGQLGNAPSRIQVAGFGGTYTFTPNLVADANFGYTRQKLGAEADDIGSNLGLDVLKIPGTNGPDRTQGGLPSFQINGGWTNLGNDNTGNPFLFRDNQYLFASNLSWLRGSHDYRFGLDYQNQQLNHFQPQGGTFQTVRGTFTFNGNSTKQQGNAASVAESTQLHSWADFLLGQAATAGKVDQLRNPNALRMLSYALYVRDHWQINRKVTLTYGLRWERYPFPDKDNTGINRYDPATGNVITGGLSGVPRDTGAKSGPGQFLPRIGIAYRWNDKTVIRGGYGQSADPRPFIDFRNAYPIVNAWSMPALSFNGTQNSFLPVTTLRQGLINTGVVPDLSKGILPLPTNSGTTTYPGTPMRKEIHSWNFLVERELPYRFSGQVGYVGTRAVGQMGFININAGAPGTGNAGRPLFIAFANPNDINEIIPYGTATYDAMQATLTRRWKGSVVGSVFTWSKAINYADNDANPRIQYMPEKERNRGPAGYDRTFNFQGYTVYDLPFGKGEHWAKDGWASKLFGGFQVNGTLSMLSGAPFYIVQGTAPNLLAGGSGQVPNQVGPVTMIGGIGTVAQRGTKSAKWFDTTAFVAENGAKFGNVGRNTLRGPGFFELDFGVFRTFLITERFKLQLRAEALNATNHANFANPTSDISNTNFGLINSLTGPNQSRQWRFAGRFVF